MEQESLWDQRDFASLGFPFSATISTSQGTPVALRATETIGQAVFNTEVRCEGHCGGIGLGLGSSFDPRSNCMLKALELWKIFVVATKRNPRISSLMHFFMRWVLYKRNGIIFQERGNSFCRCFSLWDKSLFVCSLHSRVYTAFKQLRVGKTMKAND